MLPAKILMLAKMRNVRKTSPTRKFLTTKILKALTDCEVKLGGVLFAIWLDKTILLHLFNSELSL